MLNVFVSKISNANVLVTVKIIIEIKKTPKIQTQNTIILPNIVIG